MNVATSACSIFPTDVKRSLNVAAGCPTTKRLGGLYSRLCHAISSFLSSTRDQLQRTVHPCVLWCVCLPLKLSKLHCESKKTIHETLGHNFTNYCPIFKIFFTSRLGSKFATNSCLNMSPRFKHVATLPCEVWMQKNGIILKYILRLMTDHKVV